MLNEFILAMLADEDGFEGPRKGLKSSHRQQGGKTANCEMPKISTVSYGMAVFVCAEGPWANECHENCDNAWDVCSKMGPAERPETADTH